jgi:hypothetical protein
MCILRAAIWRHFDNVGRTAAGRNFSILVKAA